MTETATRVATPSGHHQQQRPLLGLRGTPGRLALAVFRTPLWLYRRGWGWLLGRTFLMLVHVGRKTGQPHEMVAMILADDCDSGEVVIFSGWGPDVDWLSNLRAGPAREVRIARHRFVPEHRFLSEDEAVAVIVAFRRRHPGRVRLATAILGWGDLGSDTTLREFVRSHPFVALHPAGSSVPVPDTEHPNITAS
jgi:deazaflavin-dependent oxidoreductase (nitroreductase family)